MFMYWEAPMFRVKNHVHVQGKHPTDLSHSTHTTPRQFRPPHLSHLGISVTQAGQLCCLYPSLQVSPSFHNVFHLACQMGLLCFGRGAWPWCFPNLIRAWQRRCKCRVRLEPDEFSVRTAQTCEICFHDAKRRSESCRVALSPSQKVMWATSLSLCVGALEQSRAAVRLARYPCAAALITSLFVLTFLISFFFQCNSL